LISGPETLQEARSSEISKKLIQHHTDAVQGFGYRIQVFVDGIQSLHGSFACIVDVVGASENIQIAVSTIASLGDYDHLRGANVVWYYRLLGSRLLKLGLIELEPVI
jgi:hypothetical protein